MEELEVTWSRARNVWWLLLWRGLGGGFLIGLVVGFIIGFVAAAAGVPPEQATTPSAVLGVLGALFWGVVVTKMALLKHYREFRIALVPHSSTVP